MDRQPSFAAHFILLVLVWSLLYLWGLGKPHIDSSIEALRAAMARQMLDSHNWLIPYQRDEPYLDKPPLTNWLIVIASLPFGVVTEWSARLPSALCTLVIALVTWGWATRRGWRTAAWYSAVLFLLLPLVLEKGVRAEIETNLALWVSSSLFCLFEATESEAGRRAKLFWTLAAYAFLGLALLSKGPPALLFFLGTWISYQTIRGWKSVQPWHHIGGWLVALFVVGLWLVPLVSIVGWPTFWESFQVAALKRVVNASQTNRAPLYFYFSSLLFGALPAWVFLPWLRWPPPESQQCRAATFLLCWLLSALVLFSLISGKESRYLLPVYPTVALLGGLAFERFAQQTGLNALSASSRRLVATLMVLTLLFALGVWVAQRQLFPENSAWGFLWAGVSVVSALCLARLRASYETRYALAAFFGILIAAKGLYLTAYVPERTLRKSPKLYCERIEELLPVEALLDVVRFDKMYIDFYLRHPVRASDNLEEFFDKTQTPGTYYLLIRQKHLPEEHLSRLAERYTIRQSATISQGDLKLLLITLEK